MNRESSTDTLAAATTGDTALYWILFFLSIALSVAVYLFLPSMISLTLVPITTFLVKALDII